VRDAEVGTGVGRKAKYWPVRSEGSPREASLKVLKRDLVAEVIGKPGKFGKAVEATRSYWRIDVPPIRRLPAPDEDVLLPPVLSGPSDLADLRAAWSHHPDLSAGPPEDVDWVVRQLEQQWQRDLNHALLLGGVPERYLEKPSPHVGYPPTSTRILSWLRFAAACVLCEVPPEQAEAFAEVGGVPSLIGDVDGESILGVIGPREQQERSIAAAVHEADDEFLQKKLWEHRSELPDDRGSVKREVRQRYGDELRKVDEQAREDEECWLELNPPRNYLIEFDPREDTLLDIGRTVGAVLAESGVNPSAHGDLSQGDLLYIMIARLLDEPGWTKDRVAAELGFSMRI
jgi:hypothetical protein